ncbi:Thiol-disulfide isomerase or thioredoxin [Salegentibacter holothuriorum]|uniref:Thiol-disulfide isomerase or thioredoxin n=1 Tax=Salegentibacter holothuriorum TaxID=241145 RepID=A0A1T5ADX7_9FLAO|nr:thioredoxin family protein [Salegentibacter holothuriorum]SKB33174.1 Thiol-disulfide isomerase or thioredoxin [Salegentibacter holothuriorum]
MKELIQQSLAKAISYEEYNLLFKKLVAEGTSTGESTKEKIDFTKLNYSRSKRLDKTIKLSEEQIISFQNLDIKQTWLVITEPWCGDAAQSLPYLNKIAACSNNIDLKIVLRDENPELMDSFLTNGSRSIPKLIIIDENQEVITHWGPRSKAATKIVVDYIKEHDRVDDQLKTNLQLWYNQNKGEAIIAEMQDFVLSEKGSEVI